MAEQLAAIYVNQAHVRLQGDPRPQIAKVVKAAGMEPKMVKVFRLQTQADAEGKALQLEEFIDRATETNPVYLKIVSQKGPESPVQEPSGSG